ncbi:MAG: hypothetical protein PHV74_05840 [Dehalococcoidia bacterium]|nr:hypothetical protein [Dehalococcoidia bacterium]
MAADLDQRIKTLADWLSKANHLVIFTGAGISTESGLADFRGPDGIWTRRASGLIAEQIDFALAEPNAAHRAIVELQRLGKLGFLITQNVDNLHLKSGVNPDLLAELHGNITRQRCTRCDFLMDNFNDMITCPLCEGILVSSVVDFGQPLPQKALSEAYRHSEQSDLFVVIGSSLVVTPAADMPKIALRSGARLVIINQGETPLDRLAHLRFGEAIGEVLPRAVARMM